MHFIVPGICNQNVCLILVTLQMFKYRTNPNGATLYTEKSQTIKMIETHFYCFYPIMTGSKIISGYPSKVWHLILQLFYCQFVVILARLCHICAFLLKKLPNYKGAMADKWVLTLVCGRN